MERGWRVKPITVKEACSVLMPVMSSTYISMRHNRAAAIRRLIRAQARRIMELESFPMECVKHLARKSCGCQGSAPELERNAHWPSCMVGRAQEYLGKPVSYEFTGRTKAAKPQK